MFLKFIVFIICLYIFLVILEKIICKKNYNCFHFLGIPGSGKSTIAADFVRVCKKHSKKTKRTAMSNVPIKGAYKLDRADIGKYLIEDSDLVIDEAGLEFGNRDFKSFTKREMTFFKEYRHCRCNLYFFSQSFDIDLKLRDLCDRVYVVEKSFFPFFIHCTRYSKYVAVDDLTGQMVDKYKKVLFGGMYVFAPRTWKLFSTHEHEQLPQKEFEKW